MVWAAMTDIPCPAKGCRLPTNRSWVCAKDGTTMFINERGIMECNGTPLHSGNLTTWGFNCGGGDHRGRFLTSDKEKFAFSLSMATRMLGRMGSSWVASLISEIENQF